MARVLRKHHFREVIINKTDEDEYSRPGPAVPFLAMVFALGVLVPLLLMVMPPDGNILLIVLAVVMAAVLVFVIMSVFRDGNYD